MASENSLIIRNAVARERLNKAVAQVAASGVEIPNADITGRDKAVAQAQELEYFATVLEAVAEKLAPAPEPKPIVKSAPKK